MSLYDYKTMLGVPIKGILALTRVERLGRFSFVLQVVSILMALYDVEKDQFCAPLDPSLSLSEETRSGLSSRQRPGAERRRSACQEDTAPLADQSGQAEPRNPSAYPLTPQGGPAKAANHVSFPELQAPGPDSESDHGHNQDLGSKTFSLASVIDRLFQLSGVGRETCLAALVLLQRAVRNAARQRRRLGDRMPPRADRHRRSASQPGAEGRGEGHGDGEVSEGAATDTGLSSGARSAVSRTSHASRTSRTSRASLFSTSQRVGEGQGMVADLVACLMLAAKTYQTGQADLDQWSLAIRGECSPYELQLREAEVLRLLRYNTTVSTREACKLAELLQASGDDPEGEDPRERRQERDRERDRGCDRAVQGGQLLPFSAIALALQEGVLGPGSAGVQRLQGGRRYAPPAVPGPPGKSQ